MNLKSSESTFLSFLLLLAVLVVIAAVLGFFFSFASLFFQMF